MDKFILEIKSRINRNKNGTSRYKFRTVLSRCGYSRRSEKFVREFNKLIKENGITMEPGLAIDMPASIEEWVSFRFRDNNLGSVKFSQGNRPSLTRGGEDTMNLNFTPYAHQKESWNHMDKHYIDRDRSRGMVVLPTGAGKTTVASYWLIRNYINRGYRILWLAHRVELLEQAFDTFPPFSYLVEDDNNYLNMILVTGQHAGWSSVHRRHNVVFSTDRSTALNINYLEQMISQAEKGVFVVIDEAHHSVASQYRNIIETLYSKKGNKDIKLLGLTATPARMNPDETQLLWRLYDDSFDIIKPGGKNKVANYKSIIYEVSQKRLIHERILSKPYPSSVSTNVNFESEFTDKDYKHLEQFGDLGHDVLNKITNSSIRNRMIVQHYKKHQARYGKTLVFAIDISHCITLNEEFRKQGIRSDYVAYSKGDNAEVIDKFRNTDDLDVIISVIKLTEGFDVPSIQTVFLTRPTRSEPLLRQMVGRGLRGPKAGGTENAYLVTFVDTWKLFKPLDSGYVLDMEDFEEIETPIHDTAIVGSIPMAEYEKIVKVAYELLISKPISYDTTIYETFPHSWYQWTGEDEGEEREETIFVFDNQYEAYNSLIQYYRENKNQIPSILDEDATQRIIYKFFDDCMDPLPDYNDIAKLVGAIRRSKDINHFFFEEKEKIDPIKLAQEYIDLGALELKAKLKSIFDNSQLCRTMYKDIFENFLSDVMKEITKIMTGPVTSKTESRPELKKDKVKLPEMYLYPEGQGYNLDEIMESIIYRKDKILNTSHFPNGEPEKYKISFTSEPVKGYFGVCRYSDKTIKINKMLDSPIVPRFVLEFLVYHEVLHVDMPNNGHDKYFRERERQFTPSMTAIKEATELGNGYEYDKNVSYYWYTISNQFLDTMHFDYDIDNVR